VAVRSLRALHAKQHLGYEAEPAAQSIPNAARRLIQLGVVQP